MASLNTITTTITVIFVKLFSLKPFLHANVEYLLLEIIIRNCIPKFHNSRNKNNNNMF